LALFRQADIDEPAGPPGIFFRRAEFEQALVAGEVLLL